MAELRYKGQLVERFADASEAQAWAAKRGDGYSVNPDRPVEVHHRGNLVETFATAAQAAAYVERRSPPRPQRRRGLLARAPSPWTIVDTHARGGGE